MKTADEWADALYDLVSVRCKDTWHMHEVRALVAEIQAAARRAALDSQRDLLLRCERTLRIAGSIVDDETGGDGGCFKLAAEIRALLSTTPEPR